MDTTKSTATNSPPTDNAATYADVSPYRFLDVAEVAKLLGCSQRHVFRQVDAGKMPRPVKLGRLNRWPIKEIEEWIAAGCPSVRRLG